MQTPQPDFSSSREPQTEEQGHGQRRGFSLGLQTKFLIGTSLILLICCLAGAFFIYFHERRQLKDEAYAKSELVMAAVEASRAYVREELRPVMFELMGDEHFIREAMSTSYVGRAVMDRFAPALPDVEYRRTSINARNPKYEAREAELEMIAYFRQNPDVQDWQGIVDVHGQPEYRRFKPVVFEQECLRCHGDPADAPSELTNMYGETGGFGRSAGELAGLISVGMPVDAALAQLKERAVSAFLAVFAILVFIFVALGVLFNKMVVSTLQDLLISFQGATGHRQEKPVRDELGLLGVSFNTMVEELHASRQRMQEWNLSLEQEVERIRLQLEKTQEQLIHTEKMAALGRMTANVTHAVRNPLIAAGGFARRLEKVAQGEQERRYAGIILSELHRLERMLKELLIYSQEKSQHAADQSLAAVIRNALDRYQERIAQRKFNVHLNIAAQLPLISMNTDQIGTVLDNLLDNALEAMPDGGTLTVTAEPVEREERHWIELIVADNGPGVSDAMINVLFEPFTTGKDMGSGLGLPICRKIIEEHGGKILVHSEAGQGASVHVFLPLG